MFLIGEPKSILNFNFQFRVMIYAKVVFFLLSIKLFDNYQSTKVNKIVSY